MVEGMANLPAWLQLGATILLPMIAGLGYIVKMLYTLDKKIDSHGSQLNAMGMELHRAESELRTDHQELKTEVRERLSDHELRLRAIERAEK